MPSQNGPLSDCYFNTETQSCESIVFALISSSCYGLESESCSDEIGCISSDDLDAIFGNMDSCYYDNYNFYLAIMNLLQI